MWDESTYYSRLSSALLWWPLFWCSLVSELGSAAYRQSGMPPAPTPLTPLRSLHNDMLPLTPRPSGYVPPRKLWLRSV